MDEKITNTAWDKIPVLTAEDIDCRVQSVSNTARGAGAILLLYKNARVDMRVLDQVFGPSNWQRTHEVIGGNLYCNIDIWDAEKGCWIRKQDVGVESNTEKEKGQASDSFKRAGFNIGIGRELYTAPFIWVNLRPEEVYTSNQNGKEVIRCKASVRFSVSHVAYNDRREISELVIIDKDGEVRYDMSRRTITPPQPKPTQSKQFEEYGGSLPWEEQPKRQGKPSAPPQQQTETEQQSMADTCPICGGPITPAERNYSTRRYGREACRKCQQLLA